MQVNLGCGDVKDKKGRVSVQARQQGWGSALYIFSQLRDVYNIVAHSEKLAASG